MRPGQSYFPTISFLILRWVFKYFNSKKISHLNELESGQCFGKGVGSFLFTIDVSDFNMFSFNITSNEVKLGVDVLTPSMKNWILHDGNGIFDAHIHSNTFFFRTSQLFQQTS